MTSFPSNSKNTPSEFSDAQMQLLTEIMPDIAKEIAKKKAEISAVQKEELHEIRKKYQEDYKARKQFSDKENLTSIHRFLEQPDEMRRYDLTTPYYVDLLNSLPPIAQAALDTFAQHPFPHESKFIAHHIDKQLSTSYVSNYLKILLEKNILIREGNLYSVKDKHMQYFLVMRYNRKFHKYITSIKASERSTTIITDFLALAQK